MASPLYVHYDLKKHAGKILQGIICRKRGQMDLSGQINENSGLIFKGASNAGLTPVKFCFNIYKKSLLFEIQFYHLFGILDIYNFLNSNNSDQYK